MEIGTVFSFFYELLAISGHSLVQEISSRASLCFFLDIFPSYHFFMVFNRALQHISLDIIFLMIFNLLFKFFD